MAAKLVRAGHDVVVHNRSRPPVDDLVAASAAAVESPADAARTVDVVVTMLPDPPDVEQVVLGADGVAHVGPGGTGQTGHGRESDRGGRHHRARERGDRPARGPRSRPALALQVLAGGLAGNRILDLKADGVVRREFRPGFRVDLHHKDLGTPPLA